MGFEPTTRGLKGRCSNQLSYGPTSESISPSTKSNSLLFVSCSYRFFLSVVQAVELNESTPRFGKLEQALEQG
ncbi:MAG: hypothetical protein JWS12_143 [Candidatus Saccharibacteria bacterium]|nr:hypothetical protein [Candidatus Saccharibacteria bacterium]